MTEPTVEQQSWNPNTAPIDAHNIPYESGTGSPSTAPVPDNIITGGRFEK